MAVFYFNGVSTTAKKKINGKFEADDQKVARNTLNKLGISILMLGEREPPMWGKDPSQTLFEYEALDKLKKPIKGVIEASGSEEVYDRLTSEFGFEMKYICKERASDEEKQKMHAEGVKQILQDKARKAAMDAEEKKRTLKGGLETLMEMAEGKHKKAPQLPIENPDTPNQENQANSQANGDVKVGGVSNSPTQAGVSAKPASTVDKIKSNLISKLTTNLSLILQTSGQAYYYLTEVIIPKPGKTRKEAWEDVKKLILPKKVEVTQAEIQHLEAKKQNRIEKLKNLWGILENTFGMLALVFTLYFVLGVVILYFDVASYYHFAETTIQNTTLIPFLALCFTALWGIMFAKDKVEKINFGYFSAMFAGSGVLLTVLGINFLY